MNRNKTVEEGQIEARKTASKRSIISALGLFPPPAQNKANNGSLEGDTDDKKTINYAGDRGPGYAFFNPAVGST